MVRDLCVTCVFFGGYIHVCIVFSDADFLDYPGLFLDSLDLPLLAESALLVPPLLRRVLVECMSV